MLPTAEVFSIAYGTQHSSKRKLQIKRKSTNIYNLYVLKKFIKMYVNVDNIGLGDQCF
jgi:predicted solute-binding protein